MCSFIIILFTTFSVTFANLPDYPNVNVCSPEASVSDVLLDLIQTIHQMRSTFTNCTHVNGNLIIRGIHPFYNGSIPDLSFLNSIREVSGYVYIANNTIQVIPLQNLVLIRGEHHYNNNSLTIMMNYNVHDMSRHVKVFDMRNLMVILSHSVLLSKNPFARHLNNGILWKALFKSDDQKVVNTESQFATDYRCHSTCSKEYCWGPRIDMCQQISMCTKRKCGRDRCLITSANETEECCHRLCAAGCTKYADNTACIGCTEFQDGDTCVTECPKRRVYNKQTQIIELNKNFKYTFGSFCVKQCPDHYYVLEDSCVRLCGEGYRADEFKSTCEKCVGECPKDCIVDHFLTDKAAGYLDKVSLRKLSNCSSLTGSIFINQQSFDHDDNKITDWSDLMHLNNVRILTGVLFFNKFPSWIKNFTFLENLQEIKGHGSDSKTRLSTSGVINIYNNDVEFLGFQSLKKLGPGAIRIAVNQNLCYVFEDFPFTTSPQNSYTVKQNNDPLACINAKLVCDPLCGTKGCWGPGPSMCRECTSLKAGRTCVESCTGEIPGFWANPANNGACEACNSLCLTGCEGPGADQCLGECTFAKLSNTCVRQCPNNFYIEEGTKACKPCSKVCTEVNMNGPHCTGPGSHLGAGGCNKCHSLIIRSRSSQMLNQLKMCSFNCPEFYFRQHIGETNNENIEDAIHFCSPCHSNCLTCTHEGIAYPFCTSCKFTWFKSTCVQKCPEDESYHDSTNATTSQPTPTQVVLSPTGIPPGEAQCKECDIQCRKGCYGPLVTDCKNCKFVKIYLDDSKTKFTCNQTCPADRATSDTELETSDRVCLFDWEVAAITERKQREKIIIGVVCVIGLFILLAIILVAWCLRKKAENEKERAQLKAIYSNIKEPDSKNQEMFNRQPVMSRLEMINIDDLSYDEESRPLGRGAFGAVYRGYWTMPRNAMAGATKRHRLEVAVKVIEGQSSGTVQELLDEAKVMASVSHRHCLRFIGVCLSHDRRCLVSVFMPMGSMDKYLSTYPDRLSSLILLSWAEQIANGMAYLELRGIIHRDLATRNVLINTPELVQITDFGLAKILEDDSTEVVIKAGRVPIRWLAIETLTSGLYSHKTDVWSYGVTLWEIFTFGKRPYMDVDTMDIKDHVLKGGRLSQPEICTLDVYMVMVKCWMEDSDSRPTFLELMKTFSNFCNSPGRYLFIAGDEYQIRGSRGDDLEMQPMISTLERNMNRNTNLDDSLSNQADLTFPYSRASGASSNNWRATGSGASPYQRDRNSRQPLLPSASNASSYHPQQPRTSSSSGGPSRCQLASFAGSTFDNDDNRYILDPTETPTSDLSASARFRHPSGVAPPPPLSKEASPGPEYVNTDGAGSQRPWDSTSPSFDDGYLEPMMESMSRPFVYPSTHPGKTSSIMNNNLDSVDNYGIPNDGDDYVPPSDHLPSPPPPPTSNGPKANNQFQPRAINNPEYFMDQYSQFQPDTDDYLQPNNA